jgi:hypothetical protein
MGNMEWRRPGENVLSMAAAARIAASPTIMWIEQRGTGDSGKEEEVNKFEAKWRMRPSVEWFSYN